MKSGSAAPALCALALALLGAAEARSFLSLAKPGLAPAAVNGTAKHGVSFWRRWLSRHRSRRSRDSAAEDPYEEDRYEGSGCEAWCAEMDDVEDSCFIPPCAKCQGCAQEVAEAAKTLQVGKINVGGFRPRQTAPQEFTFAEPFAEVPVVVLTANCRGPDPAAIRVKSVTKTGFTAVIAEPPREDGPHADMDVVYVAAVPGGHSLPDGRRVLVGTLDTTKEVQSWRCKGKGAPQAWETLTFEAPFSAPPAIVAQIQTMANEAAPLPSKASRPFLTVAMEQLSATAVKVALERAEVGNQGALKSPEQIGYIAVEAGAGSFAIDEGVTTVNYAAVLSGDIVKGWGGRVHKPKIANVPFGKDLGAKKPLVVSSQVTRDGGDGGWVRIKDANSKRVRVTIDEDRKCDRERGHTTERVGVLAFSTAFAA